MVYLICNSGFGNYNDRLAKENYLNKLGRERKRKVPSEELICRIHGL